MIALARMRPGVARSGRPLVVQAAPYVLLAMGAIAALGSLPLWWVMQRGASLPPLGALLPLLTTATLGSGLTWLAARHAASTGGVPLGLLLAFCLPLLLGSLPLDLAAVWPDANMPSPLARLAAWSDRDLVVIITVLQPLAFALVAGGLARRGRLSPASLGLRLPSAFGWLTGLGVGTGAWLVSLGYTRFLPQAALSPALLDSLGPHLLLFSVAATLLAPIGEELFFRGYALTILTKRHGLLGYLLTAGLFAAAHLQPAAAPLLLTLGLALGYLRAKTHSIVPPLLAHACFNGLGCVLLLLSQPR